MTHTNRFAALNAKKKGGNSLHFTKPIKRLPIPQELPAGEKIPADLIPLALLYKAQFWAGTSEEGERTLDLLYIAALNAEDAQGNRLHTVEELGDCMARAQVHSEEYTADLNQQALDAVNRAQATANARARMAQKAETPSSSLEDLKKQLNLNEDTYSKLIELLQQK